MKKLFKLTQDGIDELKTELEALLAGREDIIERIKSARELGDLSENAEYASARAEQDKAEGRIAEIEHILKNVAVITQPKNDSKVQLGSKVVLKGEGGKTLQFQVVGTVEADPMSGKISDESPIGKALLGKHEDDEVEIVTPAETSTYTVADIS